MARQVFVLVGRGPDGKLRHVGGVTFGRVFYVGPPSEAMQFPTHDAAHTFMVENDIPDVSVYDFQLRGGPHA